MFCATVHLSGRLPSLFIRRTRHNNKTHICGPFAIDSLQLHHFWIATVVIRHVGLPTYASLLDNNHYYPPCWYAFTIQVIHCASSYSLCTCMMAKETAQKGFIPGYASTITDAKCKQQCAEKLNLINGHDPYKLPREE